jgi:hypothetical protein
MSKIVSRIRAVTPPGLAPQALRTQRCDGGSCTLDMPPICTQRISLPPSRLTTNDLLHQSDQWRNIAVLESEPGE